MAHVLGALIANFVFLVLSIFLALYITNNLRLRLATLAILSILLLGLPSFLLPQCVMPRTLSYFAFAIFSVYPSILILLKLKYGELPKNINRPALTISVSGTSITLTCSYIVCVALPITVLIFLVYIALALFSESLYAFYLLFTALPQFFLIFTDDTFKAARLIVAYDTLFFLPSLLIALEELTSLVFLLPLPHLAPLEEITYYIAHYVESFLLLAGLSFVIVIAFPIIVYFALSRYRWASRPRLLTLHILFLVMFGIFGIPILYSEIVNPYF